MNSRMADDKLACCRSTSIAPTRSDTVVLPAAAMALSAVQKASSKLTLVLCPAILTGRMTTDDFIAAPHPFPQRPFGSDEAFFGREFVQVWKIALSTVSTRGCRLDPRVDAKRYLSIPTAGPSTTSRARPRSS